MKLNLTALAADLVFAVGPKLKKSAEDKLISLDSSKVIEVIPGLEQIEPCTKPPNKFSAMVFGRLGKEDDIIKQPSAVVAAFADAHNEISHSLGSDPKLILFGSDISPSDAYRDLTSLSKQYYNGLLNIQPLPYETNRHHLLAELSKQTVCLMPSFHEGFGLVAWEAIAAGVPVILSKNSGVYEFIEREYNRAGVACLHEVSLQGSDQAYAPNEHDVVAIKEAILRIAKDPQNEKKLALDLRSRLQANGYSWEHCAEQVAQDLGFEKAEPPSPQEGYKTLLEEGQKKAPSTRINASVALVSIAFKGLVDQENHDDIKKNPLAVPELRTSILEIIKAQFPDADRSYPEGTYYDPLNNYDLRSNTICIILDHPTAAVRASVEFFKALASSLIQEIECTVAVDFGNITGRRYDSITYNIESEMFSRVILMHQETPTGHLMVSAECAARVDETLVIFSKIRSIGTAKDGLHAQIANFENPTVLQDSYLAQAVFISDLDAQTVRTKTFEALALQCLTEKNCKELLTVKEFNKWLKAKGLPEIPVLIIEEWRETAEYIRVSSNLEIEIPDEHLTTLRCIETAFLEERERTVKRVSNAIASAVGLDENIFRQTVNVATLLENYLVAVFLEIRMMANYFRSTQTLFRRLTVVREYDYVFRKHMPFTASSEETLALVREAFLDVVGKLAEEKNEYIAAIFHNVLMLYYLNRNMKVAHREISSLRRKRVFLDTNAFYAYHVKASHFGEMLRFTVNKLRQLGVKICFFDKNIIEYNHSLERDLEFYKKNPTAFSLRHGRNRWIWAEYQRDKNLYAENFEYCVALHRIPRGEVLNLDVVDNAAINQLKQREIDVVKLEPFYGREELGDIYNWVSRVKNESHWFSDGLDEHILLLDANVIQNLESGSGSNPMICENLFVTCDFSLARIRNIKPKRFEFIVTAPEFYEFMIPYLFLSDKATSEPVEMPNILLAAVVAQDTAKTESLRVTFNKMVTTGHIEQDFKLLAQFNDNKRFDRVKSKFSQISKSKSDGLGDAEFCEALENGSAAYTSAVREQLRTPIIEEYNKILENRLQEAEKTIQELQYLERERQEKERRKIKYEKKIKRMTKK